MPSFVEASLQAPIHTQPIPGEFPMEGVDRLKTALDFLEREIHLKPLKPHEIDWIAESYNQQLINGLREEDISFDNPSSLKMIPTALQPYERESLHRGDEALVIEIGGSKVRGAIITVDENGQTVLKRDELGKEVYIEKEWGDDKENRTFGSLNEFITDVLQKIDPIFQNHNPKALAVIYAAPADAKEKEYGIDVIADPTGAKELIINGVNEKLLGQAFYEVMTDKENPLGFSEWKNLHLGDIPIVVMNDTPAVLLSKAGAKIGGVVGSGFNLAVYFNGIIYNSESGIFTGVPLYDVAEIVDRASSEPDDHLAEKQVGGLYLEPEFNLLVETLEASGLITGRLSEWYTGEMISAILGKKKSEIEKEMGVYIDDFSFRILKEIANRLTERSAQIVGTMFGTAIYTFSEDISEDVIEIPIEGSVFWGTPGYMQRVKEIAEKISGKTVEFVETVEHAGIIGAGATVLSRIHKE